MSDRTPIAPVTSRHNRRAFLRGAVATAAVASASAVLAACGGSNATSTSAPAPKATTAGSATTTSATTAPATVATAAPATSAPTVAANAGSAPASTAATSTSGTVAASPMAAAAVDGKFPAPIPGVPDAYAKYPPAFKSVDSVPGKGGKLTAFLSQTQAPPTPRAQNKYWQELEKRLGSTWEPTFVANGTFDEKFAALIAGGDLPDIVTLNNTSPDQVRAIQQGAFADLTSYLTGDDLKEFPNLAAIPAPIWKNLALKGKIYGVPKTRYIAGDPLLFRGDWLEKLGNPKPKNATEFSDFLVQITKTDFGGGKPYAISSGVIPTDRFSLKFFREMFRVPYDWRVNSDGSLTNYLETDEFRQTLDYMRKLFTLSVFHPDAATDQSPQLKDGFAASKFAAYTDTITGMPGNQTSIVKVTPGAKVIGLVPPGFDGGKPIIYNNIGYASYMGISAKAGKDKERVREILRIFNYWAAPFGSEEKIFIDNGIEGVDFTYRNGVPIKTDTGTSEIQDLSYTVNGPFAFFNPDLPGFAQYEQQLAVDLIANGVNNPTTGLFSPTNAAKGGELNQLLIDRTVAIVTGREPLTALDQWIKDWRSRGGDTIRKEYQDAMKA